MSRIGKKPIVIPPGVTVSVVDSQVVVRGSKGELKRVLPSSVIVAVADNEIKVTVNHPENREERALWGTYASHLRNMIVGVTQGFKKQLEVNGVGYRVSLSGGDLKLEVGFSHPVLYSMPKTVQAKLEKNIITLESADRELLGQVAAAVRAIRPPEPYKGKGIKYLDEVIRRKAGKAAKAASAAAA